MERILISPSFVPIAIWPALLTAMARLCLLGVRRDKVEAPLNILFFPCFSLMTPVFYVLFVAGLKQMIVLSSAVV